MHEEKGHIFDEPVFMLAAAMDLLREVEPRDALIFIARYYYELSLREIGRIFQVDKMYVLRSVERTKAYYEEKNKQ